MKRKIIFLLYVSIFVFELKAQEIKTFPIESIDPGFESNHDLDFLKKEIGDSQIVFLGEQDHGDGATFLAKTRLIKFLIAEMDFSVIAFEADFLTLSDTAFSSEKKWNQLPGIWKNSDQLIPLKQYIEKEDIELAGFDLFAAASVKEAAKMFEELYWKMVASETTFKEAEIRTAVHAILIGSKANKKLLNEVYRLTPLLVDKQEGFLKQLVISFQYVIESYQALPKKGQMGLEKYSERDTHMAMNLK